MVFYRLLFIVLPFFVYPVMAQSAKQTALDTANINEQFEYVIKKSTNYNNYRVIKNVNINKLKSHVTDTIDGLKSKLSATHKLLLAEKNRTDSLHSALKDTKSDLASMTELKNSITLLGIGLNKITYNTIMWASVFGLLAIALFSLILFKRSNIVYRRTKADLEEFKEELEFNRRRAREREEKIVRKLHDEINKYKKKIYQLEKNGTGN